MEEQQSTQTLTVIAADVRNSGGFINNKNCIIATAANRQLPLEKDEIWIEILDRIERVDESERGAIFGAPKETLYHRKFGVDESISFNDKYKDSQEFPDDYVILELELSTNPNASY